MTDNHRPLVGQNYSHAAAAGGENDGDDGGDTDGAPDLKLVTQL